MKVWIDQDLCTGDGLCEEICPEVFTLLDDGLAYVKEGSDVKSDPGGAAGVAQVPSGLEDAVTEASERVPRGMHLHRGVGALRTVTETPLARRRHTSNPTQRSDASE